MGPTGPGGGWPPSPSVRGATPRASGRLGRVSLIGEHTDYNDGFVLPAAAIDRLVLARGRRGDGRLRLWSLQAGPADLALAEVGPGRVEGWAAYPAGVAWALGQAGVELGGADLVVDGDVPAGSGLSSSAALEPPRHRPGRPARRRPGLEPYGGPGP